MKPASLATLAFAAAACAAAPLAHAVTPSVVSLTPGFTFDAYTGLIVGAGLVDTDNVLYYIDEKTSSLFCPVASCKSYLIFFDPATKASTVQATLQFEAPIVATFSDVLSLPATSVPYGANGFVYFPAILQGPETFGLESPQDSFSTSGNRLTISFLADDPGDHIRVLVAVPEAGTSAMLAAGLLTVGWLARRQRGRRDEAASA